MKWRYSIGLITLLFTAFFLPVDAWTDLDESIVDQISLSGSLSGQTETELPLTGQSNDDNSSPPFLPQPILILSEVFFDGSDERFEITNIGSGDFYGSLTIQGVKSTDLLLSDITILSGMSTVWGDTLVQIFPKSLIRGSGLGLSISDTATLTVQVYASGTLVDQLTVPGSTVSALSNNYWREKVWSGQTLHIAATSTWRVNNISGSRIANPGVIRTLPIVSISPPASTGSIATGGELALSTGSAITWFRGDVFTISEIHPGSDILPEYVELHFVRSYSGSIVFGWLGSSAGSKLLTLQKITGEYVVITDSLSWFLDNSPVMLIDSVSLTDGGEFLEISDLSGNIYAQARYTGSFSQKSWYANPTNNGVDYSISNALSPGFSEKAFLYLPAASAAGNIASTAKDESEDSYYQSLYKKWKDRYYELKTQIGAFGLTVNTAGMVYRKGSSSAVELVDGAEDFMAQPKDPANSTLSIIRLLPDADGSDDGNEQVTIQLLSGESTDLQDFVIHICSKKTPLQGPLTLPGDQHTLKGTFGFTNKPSCVTLEKSSVVYDTFCYGQPKAGQRISLSGSISDNALSGLTDFSWMKELRFSLLTGEVCALFGDTPFNCLPIKPALDTKKVASYEKKLASLQTKFDKKAYQYTGLAERYKKTKNDLELKRRKYYNQVKTVRASYKEKLTDAQLTSKIRKNYGQLLQSDLKKNRQMVRQQSDILAINELLEDNLAALAGEVDTISLHGQTFKVGDLRKQHAFSSDPALRIDARLWQGLSYVYPAAATQWNIRIELRYEEQ